MARGIRVIVDGVYNHAEADSPLAKISYEYWFYRENPDPANMQWGPKYNYDHYDSNLKLFPARKYVIESICSWLEHFHIDGIRFDATRALANFDVMREFTDAAFNKLGGSKPFFTVAEHIPEDPAIAGYPKGPMIAAWHETLANQLLRDGNAARIPGRAAKRSRCPREENKPGHQRLHQRKSRREFPWKS